MGWENQEREEKQKRGQAESLRTEARGEKLGIKGGKKCSKETSSRQSEPK